MTLTARELMRIGQQQLEELQARHGITGDGDFTDEQFRAYVEALESSYSAYAMTLAVRADAELNYRRRRGEAP